MRQAREFEALVLECSLIKRYMPKYNILLKDDKGYPYLRLNMKDIYPTITIVSKIADDGAEYFGPYGSRGVTHSLLEAIRLTLKLPGCSKVFPRDVGKDRPCLNYHMNQCEGWCQESVSAVTYRERMEQARQLLQGQLQVRGGGDQGQYACRRRQSGIRGSRRPAGPSECRRGPGAEAAGHRRFSGGHGRGGLRRDRGQGLLCSAAFQRRQSAGQGL